MTGIKNDHPDHLPYIELTEEGRKISFRRDCLGATKISRKVNNDGWELLIQSTSTPYVDAEKFPPGTSLSYAIELEQDNQLHKYHLEAKL